MSSLETNKSGSLPLNEHLSFVGLGEIVPSRLKKHQADWPRLIFRWSQFVHLFGKRTSSTARATTTTNFGERKLFELEGQAFWAEEAP